MTPERAIEVVTGIDFGPNPLGMELHEARFLPGGSLVIVLVVRTTDSKTGAPTRIYHRLSLDAETLTAYGDDDVGTERRLVHEVLRHAQNSVQHEISEWIKYKGKLVDNPHIFIGAWVNWGLRPGVMRGRVCSISGSRYGQTLYVEGPDGGMMVIDQDEAWTE